MTGDKVQIGGRDFRIRPDEGLMEAQTGQTQFMRERDDWGNWFGNNNSHPMYHFVLDDHYLRRNPHIAPPEPRVQVSLAPGAAPVFPASRTLPRFNDQNAINRFTSACSAIIYRDDLFGPHFAGNSFVSEPVHNLVHREVVYSDGFTFHSRRAEDELSSEFLASTDNWCRPAMIRVGPDGALWMADMYRQVIEHPEWIPKDVQAKYDLRAGHDKGRIYRVYPVGVTPRPMPRFDRLDTAGLVAALVSPSGWQRDIVQQLLIERNDRSAVPLLRALLADKSKPVLARLHALCALDGLKAIDAKLLRSSLGIHPGIDRHVVRLSEAYLDNSPELAAEIAALTNSADPQLLMQLAYSLGEWHSPEAGKALARLALRLGGSVGNALSRRAGIPPRTQGSQSSDSRNATEGVPYRGMQGEGTIYLQTAILSSVNAENLPALVETVFSSRDGLAGLDDFIRQLAMLSVMMNCPDALSPLAQFLSVDTADNVTSGQLAALEGLFDGLNRRHLTLDELASTAPEAARTALAKLREFFAVARAVARDPSAPDELRLRAIKVLGRYADERAADLQTLANLLSPQMPAAVQSAAVTALAATGDKQASDMLLAEWPVYGPELRGQVVDVLIAREAWLRHLLDEIKLKKVPAVAIDAARRQRMLDHPQEEIRQQAATLFAGEVNSDRQQVIDRYREASNLSGSAERGAVVYQKRCATCHRLADVGHAVGPDLSALSDRSPQAMLTAIFDPNRAVEAKFLYYTAITNDGVSYNGILASETGNTITLLAADGKAITLVRDDLDALASSTKSLMPEGLEKDLSLVDVADLLAFLSGFRPPRKNFEGNEPKVVLPEALRGEFWLLAANAEIYGKTLVFEPQYRNLGWWQSGDDHAIWSLEVSQPGKYAVSLDYACDNSAAGQTVAVEIAGQRFLAKVTGTGNWDTYRQLQLGQVQLAAGRQQLVVRPDGLLHGPLIDLKSVRLRPVK
jgi:putative heme-binding domain-containing protein